MIEIGFVSGNINAAELKKQTLSDEILCNEVNVLSLNAKRLIEFGKHYFPCLLFSALSQNFSQPFFSSVVIYFLNE